MSQRMKIHLLLIALCAAIIILPQLGNRVPEDKAQKATAAATTFLAQLDGDRFEQSWQDSASLLREKVSREQWTARLADIRNRFGKVQAREQQKMMYETTAKDSPDGEYITIIYETRFEKKDKTRETVTAMLDTDQSWRIAGYFLK